MWRPFSSIRSKIERWNAGQLAVCCLSVLLLIAWCFWRRATIGRYLDQPDPSIECEVYAPDAAQVSRCYALEIGRMVASSNQIADLRFQRAVFGWAILILALGALRLLWIWFSRSRTGVAQPPGQT